MEKPIGYIVIKQQEDNGAVVALDRNHTWRRRKDSTWCYVHTPKSVKRAIRRGRTWTKQAVTLVMATYNRETRFAEPTGEPFSFADFVRAELPAFSEAATQ